jgi:hypothetical protein
VREIVCCEYLNAAIGSLRMHRALLIILIALSAIPAAALTTASKVAMVVANGLFIAGGLGVFAGVTMDVVDQQNNSTRLQNAYYQVAASSLVAFSAGSVASVVASELRSPQLLERMDEIATGMTAIGFASIATGVWSRNTNAMKAGTVFLVSFYSGRALLLPLIMQKNAAFLRPSDKILLSVLTGLGNTGGVLLAWATFETQGYRRQILQAGLYILGIVVPVTLTGLTINLFRAPMPKS